MRSESDDSRLKRRHRKDRHVNWNLWLLNDSRLVLNIATANSNHRTSSLQDHPTHSFTPFPPGAEGAGREGWAAILPLYQLNAVIRTRVTRSFSLLRST